MKITRIQAYVIGLAILMSPCIIYRMIWLSRSRVAMGYIIDIYTTRRFSNTYPRIQFLTSDESIVTFSATYNMKYEPGDSLEVRYVKGKPTNCLINRFWIIWAVPAIVNGFLFVFWTFIFVRDVIPRTDFIITMKGIRSLK